MATTALNGRHRTREVVRWDDDELLQLAEKVIPYRANRPQLSLIELVNNAQQALVKENTWDKSRTRDIKTMQQLERLMPVLRQVALDRETAHANRERYAEVVHTAVTRESVLEDLSEQDIVDLFADTVLPNVSPEDVLKHHDIDSLLGAMPLSKVAGAAIANFVEAVGEREVRVVHTVQQSVQHLVEPAAQVELPRIALYGFHTHRWTQFRERFVDRAVLKFYDHRSLDGKAFPAGAVGAILWCNGLSPRQRQVVRKAIGSDLRREQITEKSGGVPAMIDEIERLVQLHKSASGN